MAKRPAPKRAPKKTSKSRAGKEPARSVGKGRGRGTTDAKTKTLRRGASGGRSSLSFAESLAHTQQARHLFWHNVIREILSSLASIAATSGAMPGGEAVGPDGQRHPIIPGVDAMSKRSPIFDGRLGVVLSNGSRVPIAHIRPVFAVGVTNTAADRWLSSAVEGTVFEITTPQGEVLTLPVHEIHAVHALNEDLLEKLRENARSQHEGDEEQDQPFGFAAFTSLARTRSDPESSGADVAGSPVYEPGWVGE